MRTLILLRHAKAVPHSGDDFARELTDKGHKDSGRAGAFLLENNLVPNLALVSPAARTRQTFEDLAAASRPIHADFEEELYNAGARQLRERLRRIDGAVKTLLVIGHNPGIAELALNLASDGDIKDFEAVRNRFPPASFAIIEFRGENWEDAAASGGQLVQFVTPDDLKA